MVYPNVYNDETIIYEQNVYLIHKYYPRYQQTEHVICYMSCTEDIQFPRKGRSNFSNQRDATDSGYR